MTEAEWLVCDDPTQIPEFLRETISDRKSLLFASACCRAAGRLLTEEASWAAIEAAERLADGQLTDEERRSAVIAASRVVCRSTGPQLRAAAAARLALVCSESGEGDGPALRVCYVAREARAGLTLATWKDAESEAIRIQSATARCVFGNPFRPVTLHRSWRTSRVVALSQGMYDSRDFSIMSRLADALQDAGCENTDILDHCRGPGPHVRGCWVVDLVLGKD